MKTIGLIGGMSWESTTTYYQLLNQGVRSRLGALHSAQLLLYSVDFSPIEVLQREGKWEEAGHRLAVIAEKLETAGAEAILLCTNTMHKVALYIEEAIHIPFLHIAEATAQAIIKGECSNVLLLGTNYTMEQPFLKEKLQERGINVFIPDSKERDEVNRIIFEELCVGTVSRDSKIWLEQLVLNFEKQGVEGVVLGCTELGLIVEKEKVPVDLFDTTAIHVKVAVDFMLQETILK